ncbi:MAG: hypothetical protein AAF637_05995 [Pseudomonadota bacterium]
MTLTAEQIRALAPAPGYKLIDRYLPDPYRRALSDSKTPLGTVTRSWRDGLKRLDHELGLVQRSRSVEFFTDLDDGTRLGAMHAQAPWEEEDTEAFRTRLAEVARLAAAGAASARRMLLLVGLATGSELIQTIRPDQNEETDRKDENDQPITEDRTIRYGETVIVTETGQGQTRGYFKKPDIPGTDGAPDTPGTIFHADVIDAPDRLIEQDAKLLRGPNYIFRLRNTASDSLPTLLGGGARTYPDPVFRLEAGEDIGPLMLVQTFNDSPKRAPRAIVINRRLRTGSVLDIDVADMAWNHDEGAATFLGTWRLGGNKEALYAGMTELASVRSRFDNEPGDPAAGYALTLRGKADLDYTGSLDDEMVDKGPIAPGTIEMPSLLGQGLSLWRVLRILPDPDGSDDIHKARFEPLPSGTDLRISARWTGRRAGEFAVAVEDQYLDLATNGPLPHRLAWLDEMITRFKLAGTIRVEPQLDDLFAGQSIPALQLNLGTEVTLEDTVEFENWGEFDVPVSVGDELEILTEFPVEFESIAELSDDLTITNEGATIDLDDTLAAGDGLDLTTETEAVMESTARIEDTFDLIFETPPVRDGEDRGPTTPVVTDGRPTTPDPISTDPITVDVVRGDIRPDVTETDPRLTTDPVITPRISTPTRPTTPTRTETPTRPVTPARPATPVAPTPSRRPVTINLTDTVRARDTISIRRPRNR